MVPTALQKFTTTNGKWDAVPVNIHSVNWVWINKAVLEKIGGAEPKTFDDFVALLDKAKAGGYTMVVNSAKSESFVDVSAESDLRAAVVAQLNAGAPIDVVKP